MTIKHHDLLEITALKNFCDNLRELNDPVIIKKNIEFLLHYYSVINFKLTPSSDKLLFRSRKANPSGFNNISELNSPPSDLTQAGRLNESKKPILYLSQNISSTFDEIRIEVGDYVQVAAYRPKMDIGPHVAIIGDIKEVFRWGSSRHSPVISDYVSKTLREMTQNESKAYLSYIYTDSFLSDLLTDKAASTMGYIHTQSIGELLFKKHPHLDGVCYQGIESEGAWNLALKCPSAEKLLEIESVWLFKVEHLYGYGLYDHTLIKSAKRIEENGHIHWV
ncbi:RES domain-containing protein [Shewanella frigidimarina]|uniref:RES domain-containing protein n=1 Tax=Shewanella frigidimarina TaxID=56812 RepID=UPI003174071B